MAAGVGLVGCGSKDAAPAGASASADGGAAAEETLTLAVIPKSTGGEFWETVEVGANEAAEELGVDIKWEGALTETEISEQKKIIENMINLGVDGIALAPLNATSMQKDVENAASAGIPVVIFDSAVEGDAHTSFVATDNPAGGGLGAKYLAESMQGPTKKVVLLRFIQGTASTEQRAEGFLNEAKKAGFDVATDVYIEDATVAGCQEDGDQCARGLRAGRQASGRRHLCLQPDGVARHGGGAR